MRPINTTVYPTPDGRYIHADYGKYGSGLLIIADTDTLPSFWFGFTEHPTHPDWCGFVKIIDKEYPCYYGTLFTTKKGKQAFRTHSDGPHVLVCDEFSGNKGYISRLDDLRDTDRLYYSRSLSNNGGAGDIYAVVSRDLQATFDVDDL